VKDSKPLDGKYTDDELWNMRYVVDSSIHPQTKEIIPMPFRTSSFVPSNIPVTIMLAVLPPTVYITYHISFKVFNQILG
jgi:hypothetical protein